MTCPVGFKAEQITVKGGNGANTTLFACVG